MPTTESCAESDDGIESVDISHLELSELETHVHREFPDFIDDTLYDFKAGKEDWVALWTTFLNNKLRDLKRRVQARKLKVLKVLRVHLITISR
jgi:hypothetical protein